MKNSICPLCGTICNGLCRGFEVKADTDPGKVGCGCSDISTTSSGMITPPSNADG